MDFLELLTMANKAGLGIGPMICIVIIGFKLKDFVETQNKDLKSAVSEQVDKIVLAIGKHNERLDNLENDVKEIKHKLKGE